MIAKVGHDAHNVRYTRCALKRPLGDPSDVFIFSTQSEVMWRKIVHDLG